jgi:hypothetical protein
MRRRSIKIFLIDGTPNGLRTAEVGLSTIKAVICPRTELDALGKRPEARKTGVYLLAGDDLEHLGRLRIYIGAAGFQPIRPGSRSDPDPAGRQGLFQRPDGGEGEVMDAMRSRQACSVRSRRARTGAARLSRSSREMA